MHINVLHMHMFVHTYSLGLRKLTINYSINHQFIFNHYRFFND